MRRRRPDAEGAIPPRLLVFDPREWPAEDFRGAFRLWQSARRMHAEEHGGYPGPLDLLREECDVRAALTGGFLQPWQRHPAELRARADSLARIYGRRPRVAGRHRQPPDA